MKLEIVPSNRFRKDLKITKKRGMDLYKLEVVVEMLALQMPLAAQYHDHRLSGNYSAFRECHIEPDWLLLYRQDEEALMLFLFRTGSHSDLF